MVVHIVMFKFKDENREKNIEIVSEMLNGLLSSVPTLKSMEVGQNFTDSDRAMDLSIITTFDDRDGLKAYATHPEHLKVVEYIRQVVSESKVVDYIKE
ncbi:Stress responsive alpha-beta barrel domain protein Dabb [hydrothermal vent metagenome]|uniref:Stress responsive alpha-beta barrel domain protein Dabb n=1 Tax=hydrothermal vent metagenome TaxID=652676 RepID=A0A1W1BRL8_9ZZZZ